MVNLTHEADLLQKVNDLAANVKVKNSVGLNPQQAKSQIQKLIPTTKQHLNVAKFYLDSIGNIDYISCLRGQFPRPVEYRHPINFSNDDLQGQINLIFIKVIMKSAIIKR